MTETDVVPRRSDRPDREPHAPRPLVDEQLADELLGRAQTEGVELLGPDGLLSQVRKAVLERALGEELTQHLGYEKHDPAGRGSGNSRNGTTDKRLQTEIGGIDLDVPRDRNGSFEPRIVRKGQTRLDGFNERIIALYARGLSTRDIRAHLREMYDVDVSADLISRVTDAVLEELQEWQSRPLDRVYPVVFIDALTVKIRDGVVTNRPVYLAIGIDCDGAKQVLGLWVGPATGESSKFWLTVLSELKSRGVGDVCIVCCDGLTGLPDAISVVWPQATVQLCVVHLIRASLRYASKRDWGAADQGPAADLHRRRRHGRRGGAGGLRAALGAAVSGHRQAMARALGGVRAVPGIPTGRAPRRVYDESDRVDERPAP
jgi:putative transposase